MSELVLVSVFMDLDVVYWSFQVVLCSNYISGAKTLRRTVLHELIHAYDYCRAQMDMSNLFHHACTEVRAAHLRYLPFALRNRVLVDCFLTIKFCLAVFDLLQHRLPLVKRTYSWYFPASRSF